LTYWSASGNKGFQGGLDVWDIAIADRSAKSRFMAIRVQADFLVSDPEAAVIRLFDKRLGLQELAKERGGALDIFQGIDKSSDTLIHGRKSPGHIN
jgi:hypothetical protein